MYSVRSPITRLSVPPGRILLETEVTVPHSPDEVWSVITDYDNLGRYMPNLQSHIVENSGSRQLVEQIARSGLVPVLQFRLLLEFERQNYERLNFRRIEGNLLKFDGFWGVTSGPNGTRIFYKLAAHHGYPLPSFLLSFAIRADTEKIMPAIVAELRRRERGHRRPLGAKASGSLNNPNPKRKRGAIS